MHRRPTPNSMADALHNVYIGRQGEVIHNMQNFYGGVVEPHMPLYRNATPPLQRRRSDWLQVEYKMSEMESDRRVAYDSAKFPFLKAVHRYTVPSKQPGEYDFTNILVPQGDEPEDYIVYWRWHAYTDTTDVQYLGNVAPIQNIYGTLSDSIVYSRIDHCHFPDFKQTIGRCYEVYPDLDPLKDARSACKDGRFCDGILCAVSFLVVKFIYTYFVSNIKF